MFIPPLVIALASVVIGLLSIGCAVGWIPVNGVGGIRIRTVMMSAETWRAGHRAALPFELAGAGVALVLVAIPMFPAYAAVTLSLSAWAAAALLVSTLLAAFVANRAALAILGAEQSESGR